MIREVFIILMQVRRLSGLDTLTRSVARFHKKGTRSIHRESRKHGIGFGADKDTVGSRVECIVSNSVRHCHGPDRESDLFSRRPELYQSLPLVAQINPRSWLSAIPLFSVSNG